MQLDMYFDYVELNRSDITAYSARCEYWIAPIVANYAGEAYGVTDYDDHDGPYWVHFPVRDGEKIAEIWRRKHHGFRTNTLAVSLHSSTVDQRAGHEGSLKLLNCVFLDENNIWSNIRIRSPYITRQTLVDAACTNPASANTVLARSLPRSDHGL